MSPVASEFLSHTVPTLSLSHNVAPHGTYTTTRDTTNPFLAYLRDELGADYTHNDGCAGLCLFHGISRHVYGAGIGRYMVSEVHRKVLHYIAINAADFEHQIRMEFPGMAVGSYCDMMATPNIHGTYRYGGVPEMVAAQRHS
jgi:hypothetical protein